MSSLSCNRVWSDLFSPTSCLCWECKLLLLFLRVDPPADLAARCFFAGGVRYAEQTVKSTAAQLNASLLLIAVIAVLIPSAFHFSIKTSPDGADLTLTSQEEGNDLLAMSHGVAILLLLLYVGYLIFQMWTHAVSPQSPTQLAGTLHIPELTRL